MEIRELEYSDELSFLEGMKLWKGEDLSWSVLGIGMGYAICLISHDPYKENVKIKF